MSDEKSESEPTETASRLFIALALPDPIVKPIGDLMDRLKKGFQFTKCQPTWVKVETMHLTLRFLGKTLDSRIPGISESIGQIAKKFSPLSMQAREIGVFPHWKRPRVLWLGVRDRTDQLIELQSEIEVAMTRLGFEPDKFDFNPHLTLARIKSNRDIEAARKIVEKREFFKTEFCALDSLVLFKSELTPKGSVHTPIKRFALSNPS